jgi:hypothetical protein
MLMHCWNILRHEAKWSDKMVEINSRGTSTKVNQQVAGNNQGEQGQSEHDDNGQPAQPEGRDSAKKCRSRGTADNVASSVAIEVLQSMNARGQIKDNKEDSQMANTPTEGC